MLTGLDHRARRLSSAWLTILPSKALTVLVQIIAFPTVYRAVGPAQFAAYAAITSIVSILGFFNLGMGGAIVTPLAHAAADIDHERETSLLSATLVPIAVLAAVAMCVAVPFLWYLPVNTLFGEVARLIPSKVLRISAIIACFGTLAAVPFSVVDSARQAYQETHISNAFGALGNALLGTGLLLSAWLSPTLPVFVAVTALVPLVARGLNMSFLFIRRPYLLSARKGWGSRSLVFRMMKDGLSYIGAAAVASALIYQWPTYYMTRTRPAGESSAFALYMQLILLVISFGVSLAQPLWPALADAAAKGDCEWVTTAIGRARAVSAMYGAGAMLAFGFLGKPIFKLWLRRPIQLDNAICWLAGLYVLLAAWEYIHWPLCLGLGAMRSASNLVLARAVVFAALLPWAVRYGPVGVLVLLCTSVILISSWTYPFLLNSAMTRFRTGSLPWVRQMSASSNPVETQDPGLGQDMIGESCL